MPRDSSPLSSPHTHTHAHARPPLHCAGDIRDPVKRDMLKGEYERQLMGTTTEPVQLGKTMLSPQSWGAQAITATPYGHCVDKSGMYIVRPLSGRSAAVSWLADWLGGNERRVGC